MSHFTVLVIGENPEEQLAPYSEKLQMSKYKVGEVSDEDKQRCISYYVENNGEPENTPFDEIYSKYGYDWNSNYYAKDETGAWFEYSTYNPKSKWDWYELGGRWSGFFEIKSGGKANAALKHQIDFDRMREKARINAYSEWEKLNEAIKDTERAVKWGEVRDVMFSGEIEKAREFYNNQPRVIAFRKAIGYPFSSLEEYDIPKDIFIQRAADSSISTFAVLKDGEWYEKGNMGWWGMASDEKDEDEWNRQFSELINSIPDNTLLSVYDCHI